MTYKIKTHKGFNGWRAESIATLGETPEGTRKLELTTSKIHGGIAACANVFIYHERANGISSKSTMMFQDFCKRGICATPCSRVTEKAVLEVHSYALLKMDTLLEEAKAFYAELEVQVSISKIFEVNFRLFSHNN